MYITPKRNFKEPICNSLSALHFVEAILFALLSCHAIDKVVGMEERERERNAPFGFFY